MAVRCERQGPCLTITLDRPKANAIDGETSRAMAQAFQGYASDDGLRVAILTGAGDRFFSAGFDLKSLAVEGAQAHGPEGFAGLRALARIRKPVIAAVNGLAVGGGFEIVLACHLVVAAENAEFFLPELQVGAIPDSGGAVALPRRIPRALALEMMLTGRRFDSAAALRHGLVNRVAPRAELMAAARQLGEEVLRSAPLAIAALLAAVEVSEGRPAGEAEAALRGAPEYRRMLESSDRREGAAAFAEKRLPAWRGE